MTLSVCTAAEDPLGAAAYKKQCAVCHDSPDPETRIPTKLVLQKMQSGSILRALESGVMKQQGAALTQLERRAVSNLLGASIVVVGDRNKFSNPCTAAAWQPQSSEGDWVGWGAGLSNWRFQSTPKLSASSIPNLRLKWAFGFPGATMVRAQPTVIAGRLFVGAHDGTVYSLDASTGCMYWSTTVTAQVRTAIAVGQVKGRWIAVAGDSGGNLHALDATTGVPIWKLRPDAHPAAMATATPVIYKDNIYTGVASYEEGSATSADYVCCTFRGSVLAIDGTTGKVIWKTHTIAEESKPGPVSRRGKKTLGPSGAGVWSSPTLDPDHGVLYVTTGDNYSDPPTDSSDAVMALSMDSGKIQWVKQFTAADSFNSSCPHPDKYNCPDSDGPDHDLGASAMLLELPSKRRALILAQKSGVVHAVDPDRKGEVLWHARLGEGGTLGGIQWGISTDGKLAYAALSDIGFARSYPAGSTRPIRTLDDKRGGGIFALRLDNGERVWQTPAPECSPKPCSPAQSAAITAMPGVVFSGSVDGHMRAYSTVNGKTIWDFNTAHEFKTVNGVEAHGGSMDAGGPVVAGGMLYVGAGYGQWGGIPGNVLLAFEVVNQKTK